VRDSGVTRALDGADAAARTELKYAAPELERAASPALEDAGPMRAQLIRRRWPASIVALIGVLGSPVRRNTRTCSNGSGIRRGRRSARAGNRRMDAARARSSRLRDERVACARRSRGRRARASPDDGGALQARRSPGGALRLPCRGPGALHGSAAAGAKDREPPPFSASALSRTSRHRGQSTKCSSKAARSFGASASLR
jgi:hypothetical protein